MTPPSTPTFTLIDHHGSPVSERTYRGSWMVVFFGFTHCKVVCPRALRRLSDVLDALGEAAGQVRALYITVDPERDTPPVMAEFLQGYPRFTGLTGPGGAVEDAKEVFRVFARRKANRPTRTATQSRTPRSHASSRRTGCTPTTSPTPRPRRT